MPNVLLVSRHSAARAWILAQGLPITRVTHHLADDHGLVAGDMVVGTLPIQVVAQLNQQGIHYVHLSLTVKESLRGKELSTEDMDACQAKLEPFSVKAMLWPEGFRSKGI